MDSTREQLTKTAIVAAGISAFLILIVIFQHNLAFRKESTIVLPAGGTYLGPSGTKSTSTPESKSVTPAQAIAESAGKGLNTVKGRIYPYFFTIADTVQLVTFPNDIYDVYAIALPNQPPENNVLIGVDDLTRTDELKKYIKGGKRSYVENWWKQFGGLTGVASVTEFKNSMGLTGFRAKFTNGEGQTPNEDIFFEVPDPNYVIHLANGPLDKAVFDQVVQSVAWTSKEIQ